MRVVKYSQDLPLTNRVTGGLTTFSLAHIGSGPAWFGAALSVGSAGGAAPCRSLGWPVPMMNWQTSVGKSSRSLFSIFCLAFYTQRLAVPFCNPPGLCPPALFLLVGVWVAV